MDETGVILSKLGSVETLVGRDGMQNYRGAGGKRTIVTATECISADSRSLLPLMTWAAATHHDSSATYSNSRWYHGDFERRYNNLSILYM
jgi:hypothetical protein